MTQLRLLIALTFLALPFSLCATSFLNAVSASDKFDLRYSLPFREIAPKGKTGNSKTPMPPVPFRVTRMKALIRTKKG
jgi:hypothetical protein